jgi:hypothetical protein
MTRPSVQAHMRVLAQQSHKKLAGSASSVSSASPSVTYICYIYDYSSQSVPYLYLQSAVECPVLATIEQTDYIDYCSYWNYSQNTCPGGWARQPGGISCSISGVTFAKCPASTPLKVKIPYYTTVRGDYVVTTTIAGTVPPTVTGTYYGNVYHF